METANKVAETSSNSTWGGDFEILNSTNMTVTNVSVEHCDSGTSTETLTVTSMENGVTSGRKSFDTSSGAKDYWIVSFLDNRGNLCTADTTLAFHSSDDLATIILKSQSFVVNIGDRSEEEPYLQKTI